MAAPLSPSIRGRQDCVFGMNSTSSWPWLAGLDGAAMLLGMLGAMLLRPSHYTGVGHAHH